MYIDTYIPIYGHIYRYTGTVVGGCAGGCSPPPKVLLLNGWPYGRTNPAHELKELISQFKNRSRMRLASVGFK